MRAMVLPKFGGPELFQLQDVPKPSPGPGEILVKVIASGVNPVDAKLRAGGYRLKIDTPAILGYDASGIIESVGAGVPEFKPGDEVYYSPELQGNNRGTYAEYNVVKASIAAKKPKGLSFEEAAAIPLAGGTAWEAVIRRINIRLGETILINGASGGVGSFALQFAKAAGAKVIASASAKNHQLLNELGADIIIDYSKENIPEAALRETNGAGVDAAFDIQGENIISRCLVGIRPFGRAASILPPQGDLTLLYLKNITLHGVFLIRERRRLEEMALLFERKIVKPVIEILPLEKVSQAHERIDSGHGRGKIVLKIAEN